MNIKVNFPTVKLYSKRLPEPRIHLVRDEAVVEGTDGGRIRVGMREEDF